jgi:hypothetical protein
MTVENAYKIFLHTLGNPASSYEDIQKAYYQWSELSVERDGRDWEDDWDD